MNISRVNIAWPDGEAFTVEAEIYNDYIALHRDAGKLISFWTVTHIPTGRAFATGIKRKRDAISLVNTLVADEDRLNFTFSSETWLKYKPRLEEILKEWMEEIEQSK